MRYDDLDQAFGLSQKEGWNQTMKDWRFLFENPYNVCIVAEKDNRVAGTATALNYGNKVAWIGMVLVDKSLRGQGAGKMLLEEIIRGLKDVESVKLDATPAGEPLYRKIGFIAEHQIFRMTCNNLNYHTEMSSRTESNILDRETISDVIKTDHTIFGTDRSYLLMDLLSENPDRAFYLKKDNSIDGYIFGREGSRFNYIGPLSSTTHHSARNLVSMAIESLNNKPVALDILEDKIELIAWLESIGFEKQRNFVRMYLNNNPYKGMVNNQYLISGPEFG